ncbi:MAG: glucose/mannose-6-phosphate isomerase [Thermoleophilaceae bacterium]|jgi:glucose/mannose-6-phosphate isomerase|nr:glucose/mannose-6-phosphate isomerase [Thermoleophilaceae bacterium]
MSADALSGEAIAAADPSGMIGDILAQPHQYEDALWRAESAGVQRGDYARGVVICGMGGSAIGADLAAAAIGLRATAPITIMRGYELPAWVGADTLVVCASYSGNTEETLHCFEQAGAAGAPRVAVTTGGKLAVAARAAGDVPVIGVPSGMQPRAAVVYMTVTALQCAELAGAAPPMRAEIEEAAKLSTELIEEWGPDAGDSEAKAIATAINGRIPVIYGGRSATAAARRWRAQINENSKWPAFFGDIPEAHHNEVVGWHHQEDALVAVVLETKEEHERMARRFEVTAEVMDATGLSSVRARARGESCTAQVMSLVLLGDLVSVYLAVLRGVDPSPVDEIENLKARLSER